MTDISTDKTLVSWVYLASTTQRGGSALTLQRDGRFDGIVFGEVLPGRWMAGSDGHRRTPADQRASPLEQADDKTLIQMAIVYRGDRISIYRNGELYACHAAENVPLLGGNDSVAVFGLRHQDTAGGSLQGAIEDARIYDRALTAAEIRALRPDRPGDIEPYAWWTFAPGQETDRMGRFRYNHLYHGARIAGGRLVLATEEATLVACARPQPAYHLFHDGTSGGPFDPNAAFYWNGRYHLHYIVWERGGLSYAHVSSPDMVHWRRHPLTLTHRRMGRWLASGTGIVNKAGVPTIIYHGCDPAICRHEEGVGQNCLGYARDADLEEWEPGARPVEPGLAPGQDPGPIARWDPDLWLEGDTYYALFGVHPGAERHGKRPTLMRSSDLETWEYVGEFFGAEMADVARDEDLSCPNFFALGNQHMLLCLSHNRGCRYYLGTWQDEKFTPTFHGRMNWRGAEVFAAESLLTPDGRRVMWAWCIGSGAGRLGVQSLPRELSLPADGVLRLKPLRELAQLRHDPVRLGSFVVAGAAPLRLERVAGDLLEIGVAIRQGTARRYGMRLLCDQGNGRGMDVVVEPARRTISLGPTTAPLELAPHEDIHLRAFVDRGIVEVFANDRQALVGHHVYAPEETGVCLFSEGGPMAVRALESWSMRPVTPGANPALSRAGQSA